MSNILIFVPFSSWYFCRFFHAASDVRRGRFVLAISTGSKFPSAIDLDLNFVLDQSFKVFIYNSLRLVWCLWSKYWRKKKIKMSINLNIFESGGNRHSLIFHFLSNYFSSTKYFQVINTLLQKINFRWSSTRKEKSLTVNSNAHYKQYWVSVQHHKLFWIRTRKRYAYGIH